MKAIKYLVAGVMMLSISAPTMAQTDKAQFDAIAKTIVDKNGDANALKDDIKAFTKLYKKNPEAMANIGRAFLEVDNYEKANEYADLAIKVGKNKAAGYLLKGDIARKQDDGGEAATWYQQATIFDKEDPTGYVKYARVYQKVDPKGAVDMLEQLRKVKPDYPVDAAAGYMYSNAKKLKTAMDYYDKVPNPAQLEDYILYDYTSTAYAIEDYEKAFRLAEIGSRTYPDYSSFNRVAFYSQNKLKDYNSALTYATKLFNKKDTLKFITNDYQFYGDVLTNLGRTEDAITAYKKVQELDPSRKDIYKMISDVYVQKKDWGNAVSNYQQYLDLLGAEANANHYRSLADIYIEQIEGVDEATKIAALRKADEVYSNIATKFDYAKDYAAYQRANIHHQINTDLKKGEAKPYYEEYITLVEPKADKSASDMKKLAVAYQYLAVHYIQNDQVAKAKEYATKLLEVKPDDDTAKQIMAL